MATACALMCVGRKRRPEPPPLATKIRFRGCENCGVIETLIPEGYPHGLPYHPKPASSIQSSPHTEGAKARNPDDGEHPAVCSYGYKPGFVQKVFLEELESIAPVVWGGESDCLLRLCSLLTGCPRVHPTYGPVDAHET